VTKSSQTNPKPLPLGFREAPGQVDTFSEVLTLFPAGHTTVSTAFCPRHLCLDVTFPLHFFSSDIFVLKGLAAVMASETNVYNRDRAGGSTEALHGGRQKQLGLNLPKVVAATVFEFTVLK
jgi:hypothetical protein